MASSKSREESQEDIKHWGGAFTVTLTEGLSGKADLNQVKELTNSSFARVFAFTCPPPPIRL